MAKFERFIYSEPLPKRSRAALSPFLRLNSTSIEEIQLFRLLSGTLDVQCTVTKSRFVQRNNYFKLDFIVNKSISAKTINDILRDNAIDIHKLEDYYKASARYGNKVYFKNLIIELTNFFYQKKKGSHATAFLHLYRSIELISYCFPLYYASKSTSYEKTYTSLKEFFTKVDGELSFFKNFVNNHLFKSKLAVLDIHLTVKVKSAIPQLQEQYYLAIKRLCDTNKSIDVKHAIPSTEIVISRRGLTSLIYDLRNRYFHLLTGDHNDNFSSTELAEIDTFYSLVNEHVINWIAVIYLEILSQKLE